MITIKISEIALKYALYAMLTKELPSVLVTVGGMPTIQSKDIDELIENAVDRIICLGE